jgi:hypothetical protein
MDKDEQLGQPVVPNGIPLSKIHHAAFDAHLSEMPRYRVVLRGLHMLPSGDRTGWLGRQDSKLCIPNDRHRTRALPQKGCA